MALRVEAALNIRDMEHETNTKDSTDTTENNDSCEGPCDDSFAECFNHVVYSFYSGGEDMSNWSCSSDKVYGILLDWGFGFFALIVLLNVVIAIVNNSWGDTGDEASYLFWKSRIRLLDELTVFKRMQNRKISRYLQSLVEVIDKVEKPRFNDDVLWSRDEPYNQVNDIDMYERPKFYFNDEVSQKILKGHSMQSDLYWARRSRNRRAFPERGCCRIGQISHPLCMIQIIVRWFARRAIYYALIILGAVTFGE